MGLYVKFKLQHQERKRNIQEESESSKGSSPAAPSLRGENEHMKVHQHHCCHGSPLVPALGKALVPFSAVSVSSEL